MHQLRWLYVNCPITINDSYSLCIPADRQSIRVVLFSL
ncbi:hypothetical protein PEC106664_34660 [Pectobacterium carotovorum subsp. carotovorum]|nr:hypothetical protein PEC106664_34660 [Pectobacterium carotovorum subsp. carotovorum]